MNFVNNYPTIKHIKIGFDNFILFDLKIYNFEEGKMRNIHTK